MPIAGELYFVRWRGKIEGPYALGQLQELAAQGQLSRLHDLSTDQVAWRQADTVETLYPKYERSPDKAADTPKKEEHAEASALLQWYYSVNGNVDGPCSASDIKQLIAAGKFTLADYVSRVENPEDWRMAMEVAEFKDIAKLDGAFSGKRSYEKDPASSSENGYEFAAASMIIGLVGIILPPLGVFAVIFGGMAKSRMKRVEAPSGANMAMTGIVLGIIEIVLSIVLAVWAFAYLKKRLMGIF